MNNHLLVVGANSYLAKHFVALFSHQFVFDGVYNKNTDKIDKNLYRKLYQCNDINNIPDDYKAVINFSAFIPYGRMEEKNMELVKANIDLVSSLYHNFPNAMHVLCSSVSIYGDYSGKIIRASNPILAPNLYGWSKIAAEAIVRNSKEYSIIRFSSLYGIGMYSKTFLPIVIKTAKRNKKITLFGDGTRLQNYLHYEDGAQLIMKAILEKNNDVYLGVAKESYSNSQIAEFLQTLDDDIVIEYTGEDKSPSFLYNAMETYSKLDWQPGKNLFATIEKMWHEA